MPTPLQALRFKSEDPSNRVRKPKAPKVTLAEWDSQKPRIFDYVLNYQMPLLLLGKKMAEDHNFHATYKLIYTVSHNCVSRGRVAELLTSYIIVKISIRRNSRNGRCITT